MPDEMIVTLTREEHNVLTTLLSDYDLDDISYDAQEIAAFDRAVEKLFHAKKTTPRKGHSILATGELVSINHASGEAVIREVRLLPDGDDE